jgi:hypothetical protein
MAPVSLSSGRHGLDAVGILRWVVAVCWHKDWGDVGHREGSGQGHPGTRQLG